MGDMLTQEEINALLAGGDSSDPVLDEDTMSELDDVLSAPEEEAVNVENILSGDEKDVLGEIGNISMGTAATTLFALLDGNKVLITTPRVTIKTWAEVSQSYDRPCVGVKVNYVEGLTGTNILILKEHDVKVIANIMMGGEGRIEDDGSSLTDLELSAIGEAMNQMVGSSSTSLSSVIKRKIDIDTPEAVTLNFGNEDFFEQTGLVANDILACVAFRMEIGDLIDSEITQIIPIDFAKDIVDKMMSDLIGTAEQKPAAPVAPVAAPPPAAAQPAAMPAPPMPAAAPQMPQPDMMPQAPYPPQMAPGAYAPDPRQPAMYPPPGHYAQPVNAQPAQFQALDMAELSQQKENIDIIMDVPLEVTVELGRTSRKIKEILEFAPGTIVDLDKLAGEPIDILVNGKFVASGEVVVVDENFAVRVTDIVNVDKRI